MITLLSSILCFFIGRHFAVVKRPLKETEEDIFTQTKKDLQSITKKERIRVISPSKVRENNLKEFEDTSL